MIFRERLEVKWSHLRQPFDEDANGSSSPLLARDVVPLLPKKKKKKDAAIAILRIKLSPRLL
jgi:hypothetical protein